MARTSYVNSTPGFLVDPNTVVHNSGRQVDWAQVGDEYKTGGFIVTANGAAAAAATSITVDALPGAVPVGTLLNFSGTGEVAVVTAAAAAGATSVTVEALDAGVEDNDTATVSGTGGKILKAGTVVAEDGTTKKIFPRSATAAAKGILRTDAIEGDLSAAVTGYGVIIGGVIYENLLPVTPDSTTKTELNAVNVGTGFVWETYSDNRNA